MTKRVGRLGHCYRCYYVWRIRRRANPSVCPRCKSKLWNVPKTRPVLLGKGFGIDDVVSPHRREILRLARRYGVRRVWVFGSVRRKEATEKSDLDLLVERFEGTSPLAPLRLGRELERIVGRKVDVGELESLDWTVRPQIEAEAVPL